MNNAVITMRRRRFDFTGGTRLLLAWRVDEVHHGQIEIFLLRGPLRLGAFVGVDDGHADLGGDTNGEPDVFAVYVGPAERAV